MDDLSPPPADPDPSPDSGKSSSNESDPVPPQQQQLAEEEDLADPISGLSSLNKSARISTFVMSDGPLRVDLSVYDGVSLKALVEDLLSVVRAQGNVISSYESRFSAMDSKIASNARAQDTKISALASGVNNLAQNVQGFVDNEVEQAPHFAVVSPKVEVEEVEVKAGAPPVRIPSPVTVQPPSPEKEEVVVVVVPEPEPESEPKTDLAPVTAPPVTAPAPAPASAPAPAPAPAPTSAPAPVVQDPSRPSNPAALRRFRSAVRKIILQNHMKNNLVGVLTSRAKKGFSIGERLKTAEDMFFEQSKRIDSLKFIIEQQKREINTLRVEAADSSRYIESKFEATDSTINQVAKEVDEFSHVARKMNKLEEKQAEVIAEVKVRSGEERSDELRERVANSAAVSNVMISSFFATRFARRRNR